MKTSPKCSLIIMHDDGHTRRVRLSRSLLRSLVVLVVLLPFFGVGGAWIGYEAWRLHGEWQLEKRELMARLSENTIALERLSNIETLFKSTRATPLTSGEVGAGPQRAGDKNADKTAEKADKTAEGSASPVPGPAGSPQAVGPPGENGIHEVDNQLIVDTGVVRVENVVPRLVDPRKLRITVDLYNAETAGQQLSGQVRFYVLTGDGQEWKLAADDAQFRISRYKKVVATSPLPGTLNDVANAAVKIEVVVADSVVFRKLYPVESR